MTSRATTSGRSSATSLTGSDFSPLKPGGEPFLEPRTGVPRHDEPRDFCLPAGFPAGMLSANAMQFFQTENYLAMVHEFQRMTRIFPLDGRPHRKGLEPFVLRRFGRTNGTAIRWSSKPSTSTGGALDDYFYTNRRNTGCTAMRCHTMEEPQRGGKGTLAYRADHRRSEGFYGPVVAGVLDRRQTGVGCGGAVRIRLRGEQPLPGREVRGRGEEVAVRVTLGAAAIALCGIGQGGA